MSSHLTSLTKVQVDKLTDRLIRRTRKDGSGCILWMRYRNAKGYGSVGVAGEPKQAHRIAYELFVGPIPPGLHVCHRCDNPPCCNPAHLFVGTNQDNMDDRVKKGRQARPRGEDNPRAKLTMDQVREIRRRHAAGGVLQTTLAREHRVVPQLICMIVNRQIWTDA